MVCCNGDIRAFDVQSRALFARTAVASQTLDLLAVASRACLDVRWLFSRHHGQPDDGIRRFTEMVTSVAGACPWKHRSARTQSGRVSTELPKSPQRSAIVTFHFCALANCDGVRRLNKFISQPVILTGIYRVIRAFDVQSGASHGRDSRSFRSYIALCI